MKMIPMLVALCAAGMMTCAAPASAQLARSIDSPAVAPITSTCVQMIDHSCLAISVANPMPVTIVSGGGGGGGGGDASAANQATEITAANLANTRLGDITSPAAGSLNARVEQVRAAVAALGTPLQAGTQLPAFASPPTFNLGTLNGAALDTTLSALSAKLPSSVGAKTGALSLSVVPNSDTVFPVDTVIKGTATNRGAIIGFTGALGGTGGSSSTTLTIATAPTSGTIQVGQIVAGTGITAGTTIASLGTGTGGTGTYIMSAAMTVTTGTAITSGGPQQIMASNSARRGIVEQNQGTGSCYVNGTGSATLDYNSLLIAAGAYYESAPTHVGTGAVSVICATAATPLYAREY